MARRRRMKGIGANVARKFSSRNNDVDGYWAMGVFYRLCANHGVNEFTLDFLSGKSSPHANFSEDVAASFRELLCRQMRKNGLAKSQLAAAFARVEFDRESASTELRRRKVWGDPFDCHIVLVDDLGKQRACSTRGYCWMHDPARERRSTRAKSHRGPFS